MTAQSKPLQDQVLRLVNLVRESFVPDSPTHDISHLARVASLASQICSAKEGISSSPSAHHGCTIFIEKRREKAEISSFRQNSLTSAPRTSSNARAFQMIRTSEYLRRSIIPTASRFQIDHCMTPQ